MQEVQPGCERVRDLSYAGRRGSRFPWISSKDQLEQSPDVVRGVSTDWVFTLVC